MRRTRHAREEAIAEPSWEGIRTVSDLWLRAVADPPSDVPFLVEAEGEWRPVGWDEAARRVDALAGGFLALGVAKGDRVGIMCRTRLEWTLCDFALISIGAVVVPVYTVSSPEERVHILADSGARLLVAENAAEYATVEGARGRLDALEQVVAIEPFAAADLSLGELEERGREHLGSAADALADARARIEEDDCLTIVYTSGATGPPKGCIHTHRNWRSNVEMVRRVPGLVQAGDRVVLHLPLAHVFARLVEFLSVRVGVTIAFCPDSSRVTTAMRSVRPTIFPSVPRVYETVSRAVQAKAGRTTGARRRLVGWALATGGEASRRRQAGKRVGPLLAAQLRLADRLVYSRVKAQLGGSLRIAVSGGAPLPREVAEFFAAHDILVLEGYGLSECPSVVSVNQPDRYRFGTVGPPVPGLEVELADDGEILVRGANVFRGYYGDEEATRAVLTENGWLRTGDLGAFDRDGFLTIVGRKKEIIVTSNGANIPPQKLEAALEASPYVARALVVGDARPYVAALVELDRREARKAARTPAEAHALVAQVVEEVNRDLGPEERLRRFAILGRDLLPEEGGLTPTLKRKRRVLEERFRVEIDELYAEPQRRAAQGPSAR